MLYAAKIRATAGGAAASPVDDQVAIRTHYFEILERHEKLFLTVSGPVQFNFVVSTNERAIRTWEAYGFAKVGCLPLGFKHPVLGFVDAFVMYKQLWSDRR